MHRHRVSIGAAAKSPDHRDAAAGARTGPLNYMQTLAIVKTTAVQNRGAIEWHAAADLQAIHACRIAMAWSAPPSIFFESSMAFPYDKFQLRLSSQTLP